MRTTAATLVAVVVLAGGCGHGGHGAISSQRVASLVVARRDLPRGFELYQQGKITRFDVGTGPRADLTRFGREDGWRADYRRQGSAVTRGPVLVVSMVDVFRDDGGAKRDLGAYRQELESTVSSFSGSARMLRLRGLGDESAGMTQLQSGSPGVRYFTLAWRRANATAAVVVSGFEGKLFLAEALKLARAQDARLRRAAR